MRLPMPAFIAATTAGGSTMGNSVRPVYPCSRIPRKISLLSPEAPELVASAASTKTTGALPQTLFGRGEGFVEADQWLVELVAHCPEVLCQGQGFGFGPFEVLFTIRHHKAVRGQVKHVGEGIADEHACRKPLRALLQLLGVTNRLSRDRFR